LEPGFQLGLLTSRSFQFLAELILPLPKRFQLALEFQKITFSLFLNVLEFLEFSLGLFPLALGFLELPFQPVALGPRFLQFPLKAIPPVPCFLQFSFQPGVFFPRFLKFLPKAIVCFRGFLEFLLESITSSLDVLKFLFELSPAFACLLQFLSDPVALGGRFAEFPLKPGKLFGFGLFEFGLAPGEFLEVGGALSLKLARDPPALAFGMDPLRGQLLALGVEFRLLLFQTRA